MADSPYHFLGNTAPVDPLTGLPKKKKQPQRPNYGSNDPRGNQGDPFGPTGLGGAAAAGSRPGPFTVPGFTPDYKSLIQQALAPFQAQLGAEGVADAGARDSQMIRALGQFGQQFDLGSASQAFGQEFVGQSGLGSVLPQANQLARQTTDAGMSFTARAGKSYKDAIRQIRNSLASRGALRSGELGYQLQEQQNAFDTGQYDARTQVQDFLGALQQGYVQAQRQRAAQLDSATREEAERQWRLNPATGSVTVGPDDPRHPAYGAQNAPAPPPFVPPVGAPPQAAPVDDPLRDILRRLGGGGQQRGRLVL